MYSYDNNDDNGKYSATYLKAMKVDLEEYTGITFNFYGAHNNMFKLDSIVLEALEDPDDGYRSYLHCVVVAQDPSGFFGAPIARVKLASFEDINQPGDYGSCRGWQLVDVDTGHVWLKFGTDHGDEWYPCFFFQYFLPQEENKKLALLK